MCVKICVEVIDGPSLPPSTSSPSGYPSCFTLSGVTTTVTLVVMRAMSTDLDRLDRRPYFLWDEASDGTNLPILLGDRGSDGVSMYIETNEGGKLLSQRLLS